jgi:hypothetical protein
VNLSMNRRASVRTAKARASGCTRSRQGAIVSDGERRNDVGAVRVAAVF